MFQNILHDQKYYKTQYSSRKINSNEKIKSGLIGASKASKGDTLVPKLHI